MWTYRQSEGTLADSTGKIVGHGYSGHADGLNNPKLQSVRDVGPIPLGLYEIGSPYDSVHHGPYVLPLTPDPTNQEFGRSAFLCHGDSLEHPGQASLGCVIMPRAVRELVHTSGDSRLQVVA